MIRSSLGCFGENILSEFHVGRNSLALSLLLLLGFASQGHAQELPFVHYTVDSELNPLPSASVPQVFLDSENYFWFVIGSSGLVRYDGHTSEVYTADDGLPGNSTKSLIEDHKGRLWVLTHHGIGVLEAPLSAYAPGERLRFVRELDGTKLSTITSTPASSMALNSDGAVWIASGAVLWRYSYDLNGKLRSEQVRPATGTLEKSKLVLPKSDGQVWVVTGDDTVGVFPVDRRAGFVVDLQFGTACGDSTHITELASGDILLGCQSGRVFKLEFTSQLGKVVAQEVSNMGTTVHSIDEAKDGSLWISTGGAGVRYSPHGLNGETHQLISRKNGLIADEVRSVLQDPEGNIWIAQSGGISKLQQNYKAFESFTAISRAGETPVLPSPGVHTVRTSDFPAPNSMWVGTGQGMVLRTPSGARGVLDDKSGLEHLTVNSQCHSENGQIWFNTPTELGVLSFATVPVPEGFVDTRQVTLAGHQATLSLRHWKGGRGFSCLSERLDDSKSSRGHRDVVCFSGTRLVECWSDDGTWTVLDREDGLLVDSNVQSIVLTSDGYLLAGTEAQGIFKSTRTLHALVARTGVAEPPSMQPAFRPVWGPSTGAPTGDVEYIIPRGDHLWVGSDKGVLKLNAKTFALEGAIAEEEGLPDNFAVSLYESPVNGNIWVGTNKGIAELDLAQMRAVRTVTRTDGLLDNEVWWLQSIFVDRGGAVYYGTPKGLSVYRPAEHRRNMKLPQPAFRYNDLFFGERGGNEIRIGYSARSYAEEKGIRYKYRLLGYDDSWSAPTADYSQKYMNLPAFFTNAHYRFELLASNNDDIWSADPIGWDFTISPPWWLRWWFILGLLLIVGLSLFAVYRQRTHRLGERARELQEFAQALQRAVDTLDDELEERRRVEGKLADMREHMVHAKNESALAMERRSQALSELETAKKTLVQAEKLSSLGQMVASISHEIANPVWLVGASAQDLRAQLLELADFLRELFDESDEARRVAATVDARFEKMYLALENNFTASGRLTDITQALRTQSRYDHEPTVGVQLNDVINESLVITGGKTKRHTVISDFGELPAISCFRSHLGQVLTNLLANAADALDEKVLAERELGNTFKAKLRIQSFAETHEQVAGVAVVVSDNGQGVPDDLREQIFEAFFTTKPSSAGTGLGLSVSVAIIQDHHGVLTVGRDDELGGARFKIWVPVEFHIKQASIADEAVHNAVPAQADSLKEIPTAGQPGESTPDV